MKYKQNERVWVLYKKLSPDKFLHIPSKTFSKETYTTFRSTSGMEMVKEMIEKEFHWKLESKVIDSERKVK